MASLALGVKFNATSSGTGDFVYSSAVAGYVGPAASNPAMVDGETYRYRAENASLSEWEWGYGVYTASTQTIARTTITLSSTGSKISFTAPPFVGVVPFPADVLHSSNLIINGDFRVNQRGYVSAATLASGSYGHDRWKAGASGGNYSFPQLKSSTQITIASGKSLIQPIEDVNVEGGTYILSWTGTAQARAGVNTLTPSGAYAASPLLITGQTAGTVMSVEFNAGTLGAVKLGSGTIDTSFVMRPFDQELDSCMRYYEKSFAIGTAPAQALGFDTGELFWTATAAGATSQRSPHFQFMRRKRATPTITFFNPFHSNSETYDSSVAGDCSGTSPALNVTDRGFRLAPTGNASTAISNRLSVHYVAEAEL